MQKFAKNAKFTNGATKLCCYDQTGWSIDTIYGSKGPCRWKPLVQTSEQHFSSKYPKFDEQTIRDIDTQAQRHVMRFNHHIYAILMLLAQIFQSYLCKMQNGALILVLQYLNADLWKEFVNEVEEKLLYQLITHQIDFQQVKSVILFEYLQCMMYVLINDELLHHYAVRISVDMCILRSFKCNMYPHYVEVNNEILNWYTNNSLTQSIVSLYMNHQSHLTQKEQKLCYNLVSLLFVSPTLLPQLQLAQQMIKTSSSHWHFGFLLMDILLAINTKQTNNLPAILANTASVYKSEPNVKDEIVLNSPFGIILLIMSKIVNSTQIATFLHLLFLKYAAILKTFETFCDYANDAQSLTDLIFGKMHVCWKGIKWCEWNAMVLKDDLQWNAESLKQTVHQIRYQRHAMEKRQQCQKTHFIADLIAKPRFITKGPFSHDDMGTQKCLLINNPQSAYEWRVYLKNKNYFFQQPQVHPYEFEAQKWISLQLRTNVKYFLKLDNTTIIDILHKIQNTSKLPDVSFENNACCTHKIVAELIFLASIKCEFDEKENKMSEILSNNDTPPERKQKCFSILDKMFMVCEMFL